MQNSLWEADEDIFLKSSYASLQKIQTFSMDLCFLFFTGIQYALCFFFFLFHTSIFIADFQSKDSTFKIAIVKKKKSLKTVIKIMLS